MFQASGGLCGESNWTEAAKNGTVPDSLQPTPHWDHWEADLEKMKAMGIETYRVSIEWSHIEPEQGRFDDEVIARYLKLFQGCIDRGIKPMITLYHFTEPLWFTKLGSFEREKNIPHFVRFCTHVFSTFSSHVSLWCTINEPAVQAFMGYYLGHFPPHVSNNGLMAATVLKNLLKAHVDVYHTLKSLPGGHESMIGLVHNVLRFKALHRFDPIAAVITSLFTELTDDLAMNFLRTGRFKYTRHFREGVHYEDSRAPTSNDFIGLNFYANPIVGFNKQNVYGPTCRRGQVMGDMFLPLDPAGFADAIREVSVLDIPIFITETGVADKSDLLRQRHVREYVDVVIKAMSEGIDIKAIYFWSMVDNYEWNQGSTKSFGFFDKHRVPRDSVQVLKDLITELKEQFQPRQEGPSAKQP